MQLQEALAAEHSKAQCDRIVNYIGADKAKFAQLIELFFAGEYRITQRAAWPLSYCVRNHPELIKPYFSRLLDNLNSKNIHPAVVRNTVRILQDVSIPKRYQGQVMSVCFMLLEDPDTPIAIKAFSLTILATLSTEYPDIIPELQLMIESQWDQATPAFRSRARRALKLMGKN